ncbi:MAG: hypothetical protein EAZ44_05310 [Cytophagia bacterium]|nr:MAG: hypothetical protein EAZ44_05310 [Cytophagia bacterium]
MMRYTILFCLFFIQNIVFSQNTVQVPDSTLELIAKDMCECFNRRNTDGTINTNTTLPKENEIEMCFGLIILKYSSILPASTTSGNTGISEELGKQVAPFLLKNCPKFVDFLMLKKENEYKEESVTEKFIFFEGVFQKIENKDYVFINIKNDAGKIDKFLWLKPFDNDSFFIENPRSMRGKKIRIKTREINEIYHHKTKKYVSYKEIVGVEEVK